MHYLILLIALGGKHCHQYFGDMDRLASSNAESHDSDAGCQDLA